MLEVRRRRDELTRSWEDYTLVDELRRQRPRRPALHARRAHRRGPASARPSGCRRLDPPVRRGAAKGAALRLRGYRTGGGSAGNVAAGAITHAALVDPVRGQRVENRRAGERRGRRRDARRGPRAAGPLAAAHPEPGGHRRGLRDLAREAAPEIARVRCVPVEDGADAGCVRVLVVPDARRGRRAASSSTSWSRTTTPASASSAYLDERRRGRHPGRVEPPRYRGSRSWRRCGPDRTPIPTGSQRRGAAPPCTATSTRCRRARRQRLAVRSARAARRGVRRAAAGAGHRPGRGRGAPAGQPGDRRAAATPRTASSWAPPTWCSPSSTGGGAR